MSLTWIDYAIIVVLLVSMSIGLIRGFVKELLSLVIWIIAFIVAMRYSIKLTGLFVSSIHNTTLRQGICFLILFIGVLLLGMLFNCLLNKLVSHLSFNGMNRLFGLIFGLLRGIALVTGLIILVQLTSLSKTPSWQRSTLLPYFASSTVWLKTFIPEDKMQDFQFINLKTTKTTTKS